MCLFCYSATMRVWKLDIENRKIRPVEVNMGQIKRVIKCIEVSVVLVHSLCTHYTVLEHTNSGLLYSGIVIMICEFIQGRS